MCYSDDPSGACYSTSSLSSSETDQISGSTNLVKTTLYDSLGREKETQVNSDPNGVVYADTQYDQGGRAYKTSNPYRSGDTVYWTTSGYDGLGRVTSVTKADGSATATVYSGNTTTVTDEAGNKRASQSNAMGQLTEVLEDPTGLDYETDYQNDVLGNVLQITQKGGTTTSANWRVRTFTFNSLGQLLCSANPEIGSPSSSVATCPVTDTGSYIAGTTRYQYDNDGELISKIAPLENQTGTSTVTTNFAYDVLGRITTKTYTDGTPAVSYAYDGSAITACTPPSIASPTNLVGRVSAMCDASGATVWSYDALGRTLTESRKIGAATDQIGYTYYLNGAVNTITYPRAGATTPLVVTYNVDASGRTYSAVGSNGVTYAQVTSTYASGAANVSLLGSNIQITDTYNSRLQPLATTAEQISTTNTLFNKTYNFHLGAGDNGNLFGVVDGLDALDLNRPNGSVNYGYDTLNRIASAATLGTGCTAMAGGTLNWGSTYTMDAWGNLTAQTPTLCTAVPLSTTATSRNQLAVATYDSAGNITQNNGLGYSYDAGGRLTNGSGTVYVYDGMGERVEKGGSKLYWKGVGSTALVETNASDLSPTQYIFFNGARIARIDPGATTAKYYVADNLGSTAAETDSLGNLLNESLYFPYGVERVIAQSDTGNNYKFTGKERDAETGLDDFGARYYASSLGRFMTPDWDGKPVTVPYASFGDPQTLNLYSYVENGPLNKVDADGHMAGGNNAVQPYLSIFDSGNCIAAINGGCTGSYLEDSGNLGAGYAEASIDGRESANDEAASVENVQATEAAAQQQQNQKLSPIDRVALKAEAGALKLTRQALASGHSAEYGGLILSKDSNGSLSSTSPIHTGETSVDIDSISVPRGYTVVGEYHTHPSVDCCESEGPSVQDVNRLRTPERASRIGYVGSAFTGQVSRYTQLEPITGAYDTHTYGTVIGTIP
jgi:RHS repeat-associated protein